jgi:protein TonB
VEAALLGSTTAQTAKATVVPAISDGRKASAKWPYVLGLTAAVAVGFFLIARPKPSSPPAETRSTQDRQAAENSQSAQAPTQPESKPTPEPPGKVKVEGATPEAAGDEKPSGTADQSGVVQRVMPQVSPSARGTIQGKVKVRVKVEVDAAGNVAKAELESAGPSKYFSRLALEAARSWKFSPAQAGEPGDREWTLHFAFSRLKTDVSAARTKR